MARERLRSGPYSRRTHIRRYDDCDRSSVVALWEAAGLLHPNNDPFADIDRKTADSPWGFIVKAEAQRLLLERGCPKVILQVRAGNEPAHRFYESLGYANGNVTSFGLRLVHDN